MESVDQEQRNAGPTSAIAAAAMAPIQCSGTDWLHLQRLDVNYGALTDAGMANLRGLTELSRLVLNNNCVSDAGLAYLDGLTALSFLDLAGTRVSTPAWRI